MKKKKRLLIKVGQKHIDDGIPLSCSVCPIALAIDETTGKFATVGNSLCSISEQDIDTMMNIELPRSAQRFIRRFDNGQPVKPFNFYLILT